MTTAFWPPTRGDSANQTERWTFSTGITASNSDRGAFHCKVTATALELYEDAALSSKVAEASGGHGAPSTRTVKTLTAVNSSGLGDIKVDFLYVQADSVIEVYPTLATDTELEAEVLDFSRWPKQSGETTFLVQHKKTVEDFVRKMQQKFSPVGAKAQSITGTRTGDMANMWVLNGRGDYELKRLQNVVAYREWALHRTIARIARTVNRVLGEDMQLQMIEEHEKMAEAAFAEIFPLVDFDADLDADVEVPRFRFLRG